VCIALYYLSLVRPDVNVGVLFDTNNDETSRGRVSDTWKRKNESPNARVHAERLTRFDTNGWFGWGGSFLSGDNSIEISVLVAVHGALEQVCPETNGISSVVSTDLSKSDFRIVLYLQCTDHRVESNFSDPKSVPLPSYPHTPPSPFEGGRKTDTEITPIRRFS